MACLPTASFRMEGGARLGTRKPASLSPHGTCRGAGSAAGAAWAGAMLVSGLAFRRRAWLAGVTSLCLAGGLWLVGGTPFSALLLARLEAL